jgi:hypothetical protein
MKPIAPVIYKCWSYFVFQGWHETRLCPDRRPEESQVRIDSFLLFFNQFQDFHRISY